MTALSLTRICNLIRKNIPIFLIRPIFKIYFKFGKTSEIRRKIAFLMHDAEMFNHYDTVLRHLDRKDIFLIAGGSSEQRKKVMYMANERNLECEDIQSLLRRRVRFSTLVSNHALYHEYGVPVIDLLSVRNVRFMYTLGKSRHNFSQWNEKYEMFLVFGPSQAEQISSKFSGTVVQMGCPRYDRYFNEPPNLDKLKSQFDCNNERKTVVWLPTWGKISSIDSYSNLISDLTTNYNVIVKTHPLTKIHEPDRVELLQSLHFTKLITDHLDNQLLYPLADLVICDYGGPMFGAIYLGRKLALLDVVGASEDDLMGPDSFEFAVRRSVGSFNLENFNQITDSLESLDHDDADLMSRINELRSIHFSNTFGYSAEVAAIAIEWFHQNKDPENEHSLKELLSQKFKKL